MSNPSQPLLEASNKNLFSSAVKLSYPRWEILSKIPSRRSAFAFFSALNSSSDLGLDVEGAFDLRRWYHLPPP